MRKQKVVIPEPEFGCDASRSCLMCRVPAEECPEMQIAQKIAEIRRRRT